MRTSRLLLGRRLGGVLLRATRTQQPTLYAAFRPPAIIVSRSFTNTHTLLAKKKKKGKGKGGDPSEDDTGDVGDDDDAVEKVVANTREVMDKAIAAFQKDLGTIQEGRPSAKMLDRVVVGIDGALSPLPHVAQVTLRNAQLLAVSPFDPAIANDVSRAIAESGLGLNPQIENGIVAVPIPRSTQETRKEAAKLVSKYTEEAKVAIRRLRKDAMDAVKKVGLPKDAKVRAEKDVQAVVDAAVKSVDNVAAQKEKAVLSG